MFVVWFLKARSLFSVDIHQRDHGAVDFVIRCAIWPRGRGEIGFFNSSGPVEADIRNRRKIVQVDKSLGGGFQFSLWIPSHGCTPGTNRRAVFVQPRYARPERDALALAAVVGLARWHNGAVARANPLANTPCALLVISAMSHVRGLVSQGQVSFLRRYPPA